jgi:peroxiredoxin
MNQWKLINHTFKFREGDTDEKGGCTFIGGTWKDITTDDLFKDRKVVLFSLPGAFTPTCSGQQLPMYDELYSKFKAQGYDDVYCISVNDAFVMNAWAKDQKAEKVKVIPDGNGHFTKGMGMLVNKEHLGFANRSWRYSALIKDGSIMKKFVEPGKNNTGADQDPFMVSGAGTMIKYLSQAGQDV